MPESCRSGTTGPLYAHRHPRAAEPHPLDDGLSRPAGHRVVRSAAGAGAILPTFSAGGTKDFLVLRGIDRASTHVLHKRNVHWFKPAWAHCFLAVGWDPVEMVACAMPFIRKKMGWLDNGTSPSVPVPASADAGGDFYYDYLGSARETLST